MKEQVCYLQRGGRTLIHTSFHHFFALALQTLPPTWIHASCNKKWFNFSGIGMVLQNGFHKHM